MPRNSPFPSLFPWLVALAVLGSQWLERQDPAPAPTTLDVRSLRVVDEMGRPRIVLAVDGEGRPEIVVLGVGEGETPIRLSVANGAGSLELANADKQSVVQLGANKDGHGGLRVATGDGSRAFFLGDDLRGNGVVSEEERAGKRVID